MASVFKRGGVLYAKWTDTSGKRRREPTQARSKAEAKALADELEVETRAVAASESEPLTDVAANTAESGAESWWALQDSNLRPLPCEGSALPLS